jgi:hypothetical protein
MADNTAETVTEPEVTNPPDGGVPAEGDEPKQTTEATSTPADQVNEDGLTEEQVAAVKADPNLSKIYNLLNKGWTQKTQKLSAAERMRVEFERDPHAAIKVLAERAGYDITRRGSAPDTKVDGAPAAEPDQELEAALTEALGDANAAKTLAPALQKVIDKRLGPVAEKAENLVVQAAIQEAEAITEAFAAAHPDYKDVEPQMAEMSMKLKPGEGMGTTEYLNLLYNAVKGAGADGDAIKKVITRMSKTVDNTPKKTSTVPVKQTFVKPPKNPTFEDAAAAAQRGELWDVSR